MQVADATVVVSDDVCTTAVLDDESPGARTDSEDALAALVVHVTLGRREDPERLRRREVVLRVRRGEVGLVVDGGECGRLGRRDVARGRSQKRLDAAGVGYDLGLLTARSTRVRGDVVLVGSRLLGTCPPAGGVRGCLLYTSDAADE